MPGTILIAGASGLVGSAAAIEFAAARANGLQFLTIRRYLGLVFASLILLLVGLAIWN